MSTFHSVQGDPSFHFHSLKLLLTPVSSASIRAPTDDRLKPRPHLWDPNSRSQNRLVLPLIQWTEHTVQCSRRLKECHLDVQGWRSQEGFMGECLEWATLFSGRQKDIWLFFPFLHTRFSFLFPSVAFLPTFCLPFSSLLILVTPLDIQSLPGLFQDKPEISNQ